MRTNYVLIDYENVQPDALDRLVDENFKVLVFVGASQTKLSFDTAAALQKLGSRAQYIRISGNGSNALDFHLAMYLGELIAADPTAFFHIISKDKGFDPLIVHLKGRKVFAARSPSVQDIPLVKAASAGSLSEQLALAKDHLEKRGANRPKTVKTLRSSLDGLFQHKLAQEGLEAVVEGLQRTGVLAVEGAKVSYA
jgi:hypothetical protein